MIFTEIHDEERQKIRPVLAGLFDLAQKNQSHPQDLFLLINLGYYDKKLENNDLGLCKYVLGLPGEAGLEYKAAYDFIDEYRTGNLTSLDEFITYKQSIRHNHAEYQNLLRQEFITIQIEQLIYLKFWESNFIIRQLYQLVRLAHGDGYDWDFDTIKKSRKKILTELVRNKLEQSHESFVDLFDSCYNSQIRNAIAHSLFYTIGDTIVFTNHQHNKGDNISSFSFDQWRPYIHKTLVIFDELIRLRQVVDAAYRRKAIAYGNKLEFKLKTKSHDEIRTIEHFPGEPNAWGNIECA
jgi:hypothetical protein